MFKKNLNLIILAIILAGVVLSGPLYKQFTAEKNANLVTKSGRVSNESNYQLVDNKYVYQKDDSGVAHLYLTVLKDYDNPSVTFDYLNNAIFAKGEASPSMKIILQEGDEKGPKRGMIGYGEKESNGTLDLRGQAARRQNTKSYRIRLQNNAGLWNGQRIINLNKHSADITRVRNKLSFDFFRIIPDMVSLRTRFVVLHVKDLSSGDSANFYQTYGLYTQVEQPNHKFLVSHGLDPNGNLYKAEMFEFFRYPDKLRNANDPKYNKAAFETVLSIRSGDNHTNLLAMLDAVNDYNQDINKVVDKYFDRNNYLTWMAANILMGNTDTQSQNFLLYSPAASGKFYFVPWDYDGAWGYTTQLGIRKSWAAEWHSGLANYWGCVLHRRFFSDPDNVKALCDKVDELSKIINKKNTHTLLAGYYDTVSWCLARSPDLNGLPGTYQDFEKEYTRLESVPEENRRAFLKSLENPMPVYLGELASEYGKLVLNWDPSFDIQGDDLFYEIQIASDPGFTRVIHKAQTPQIKYAFSMLPAGTYYWKVVVHDSKGHTQIAFDDFQDDSGNIYHGVKSFRVR
ncbi:MAG: CotH kinase family protein [Chitinophagales bacterium]